MTRVPNCAVVFKAYFWDEFVERQARRLAAVAGSYDFYISLDETGGAAGPVAFDHVIRFTCADLEAAGLAMRSPFGDVLWWNPDYAHYQFLERFPNYDYYLFVEYDCVLQCSIEKFVDRAVTAGADLVAMPMLSKFHLWHWWPYQRNVYAPGEVQRALLNVCFLSSSALRRLHQRRLNMGSDPSVSDWPNSELFVPSEVARAGMKWFSLGDFGDLSHYVWFPPTLEEDLPPMTQNAFFHPVLDRRRYLASMWHNRGSLKRGELNRALSRFSPEECAQARKQSSRKGVARPLRYKFMRKIARVLHQIELLRRRRQQSFWGSR